MSWLRGTWHGQYTYDASMELVGGVSVPFRMTLKPSWFRRLRGTVRDDASRGGQPEIGWIRGEHRKPEVSFTKTMSEAYCSTEEGSVRMSELWMREDPTLKVDRTWALIHYRGRLDPTSGQLAGNWEYLGTGFEIDGHEDVLVDAGSFGSWTARLISPICAEL